MVHLTRLPDNLADTPATSTCTPPCRLKAITRKPVLQHQSRSADRIEDTIVAADTRIIKLTHKIEKKEIAIALKETRHTPIKRRGPGRLVLGPSVSLIGRLSVQKTKLAAWVHKCLLRVHQLRRERLMAAYMRQLRNRPHSSPRKQGLQFVRTPKRQSPYSPKRAHITIERAKPVANEDEADNPSMPPSTPVGQTTVADLLKHIKSEAAAFDRASSLCVSPASTDRVKDDDSLDSPIALAGARKAMGYRRPGLRRVSAFEVDGKVDDDIQIRRPSRLPRSKTCPAEIPGDGPEAADSGKAALETPGKDKDTKDEGAEKKEDGEKDATAADTNESKDSMPILIPASPPPFVITFTLSPENRLMLCEVLRLTLTIIVRLIWWLLTSLGDSVIVLESIAKADHPAIVKVDHEIEPETKTDEQDIQVDRIPRVVGAYTSPFKVQY